MDSRREESRRLYTDSQNLRSEGQALCSHLRSLLAESTQLRLSAATLKRQIQHTLEKLRSKIPPPLELIKLRNIYSAHTLMKGFCRFSLRCAAGKT